MNLTKLRSHLIYDFKSDSDFVKAIEEISFKFTQDRTRIDDYLRDPRLVAAYTAFYLLTNLPKLEAVLKWMPVAWIDEIRGSDFIDLGSGPGTFSIAWKNFGGSGEFYQVETSDLMRRQAKAIWEGHFSEKLHQSSRWEWHSSNSKFLLFGHAANEMSVDTALDYIERINPEHILFIEPGTKDFFPKMLSIREELLKRYHVLYPCPEPLPCPMRGTEDWCHQFIHIKHDPEIERISQMAKKDRKLLPLTVAAFSRTFSTQNPQERLVRVLPETKFSFEWDVCHSNQLERYQIMKRDLSKTAAKEIGHVLSGEAIASETVKILESSKRVRLK